RNSQAASWTEAALRWSGPERTRRTEPRWGAVSVYCRAIRRPVGRRRERCALSGALLCRAPGRAEPRGHSAPAQWTALRAGGFPL
ncbi:MAG: hypothetical protein WCQ21_35145, partial [Verrucomicrobiota bacterium]